MSRARMLKPSFFLDEELAALSFPARLLFQGLWQLADREGRLEDRPKWIQAQVFPYDHLEAYNTSIGALLGELAAPRSGGKRPGFIRRYEVEGRAYIQVEAFKSHQHPHPKEPKSELPTPPPFKPPAVEIHGKTRKETAGTSESESVNGVGIGVNGIHDGDGTAPNGGAGKIQPFVTPWNTDLADDWIARYGEPPPKAAFKATKPLVKKRGWPEVRPVLRYYLAETPAEYVNVAKFASMFGEWKLRAEGGLVPARASPNKPATGERTMDSIRKFAGES